MNFVSARTSIGWIMVALAALSSAACDGDTTTRDAGQPVDASRSADSDADVMADGGSDAGLCAMENEDCATVPCCSDCPASAGT